LKQVSVRYPDGRIIQVPEGTSVLAASLAAGIPHATICGGRGRCSACRVRVLEGLADHSPPDHAEEVTLANLGAGPDVRLGCRLKLRADLAVEPLMPPDIQEGSPDLTGRLMPISVMFVDIRGYSRMSARLHPFDVVFRLNRFFDMVSRAVTMAGGVVDKYMGDGVMALFGLNAACAAEGGQGVRESLLAARGIGIGLRALNADFAQEQIEPLRIGIGIHLGEAIVGRFGWGGGGTAPVRTAIGEVVNTASRLETLTKTAGCQLLLSEDLARAAGDWALAFPPGRFQIPNCEAEIDVRMVADAAEMEVP